MKKKKRMLFIILAFIAGMLALIIFAYSQLGTKNYQTLEQYQSAGGVISFEIPENATDCRYAIYKLMVCKGYFYSFELDRDSLEKYVADIVEHYHINEDDRDKQYGYGRWYGKRVKDCRDESYTLDDFPVNLPFSEVIDDSIENYEVILYNPRGTGTRSNGVVMNQDTYRVVVYKFDAVR